MDAKVVVTIEHLETSTERATVDLVDNEEKLIEEQQDEGESARFEVQREIIREYCREMEIQAPRFRRYSDIPTYRGSRLPSSQNKASDIGISQQRVECEPRGVDSENDENLDFLVKPMPKLQVCPADDMVLEEEKRRRRHQHAKRSDDTLQLWNPYVGGDQLNLIPALGRDDMAIRHKYWKQLGICPSRQELERVTKRLVPKKLGHKVLLNDVRKSRNSAGSLLHLLMKWCNPNDSSRNHSRKKDSDASTASDREASTHISNNRSKKSLPLSVDANSETSSNSSSVALEGTTSRYKASVRFMDEADLYYIPMHKEYSKRQRDSMWHTREEFIAMVERNLECVFEELESSFDSQPVCPAIESDCDKPIQSTGSDPAPLNDTDMNDQHDENSSTVSKRLHTTQRSFDESDFKLCLKRVQVNARARSSHQIRFKYLKHLGIDS